MRLNTVLSISLLAILSGCGSSGTPAATPDMTSSGGQDAGATETFVAKVIEFGSNPQKAIAGADVVLLDDNAQPTATTIQSAADGSITVQIPTGKAVGFKVSKAGNKNTYQFGLRPAAGGETLWIVTETLYTVAPAAAGLTVDPAKGILAGSIYWVDPMGVEKHVGCAKVSSDGADTGGNDRYFNPSTGLPTTIAAAPTTSKNLGYFILGNIELGKRKVTAKLDDMATTVIGSVDVFAIADAICINNIYATGAANPTPANCPR